MTPRPMTAEEVAAEYERRADESAAHARALTLDAIMRSGLTRDAAETWLVAIEDAVLRDCARRCDALREDVDPDVVCTLPVLSLIEDIGRTPPRRRARYYHGARAGALLCAEAIRETIKAR